MKDCQLFWGGGSRATTAVRAPREQGTCSNARGPAIPKGSKDRWPLGFGATRSHKTDRLVWRSSVGWVEIVLCANPSSEGVLKASLPFRVHVWRTQQPWRTGAQASTGRPKDFASLLRAWCAQKECRASWPVLNLTLAGLHALVAALRLVQQLLGFGQQRPALPLKGHLRVLLA